MDVAARFSFGSCQKKLGTLFTILSLQNDIQSNIFSIQVHLVKQGVSSVMNIYCVLDN